MGKCNMGKHYRGIWGKILAINNVNAYFLVEEK